MMTESVSDVWSIAGLAARLAEGSLTSVALVSDALRRARDGAGQGPVAFTVLYDDALAQAAQSDRRRAAGRSLSPLDGLPISVKDLCDVAAEPTRSGAVALGDAPPAARDAEVVRRLRAAGAVIPGKTNMTEFAFSGLGLNPHFGTPLSPWQRQERRIAGGSSSGAAVSVTDRMAVAGLGSDTGGSIRAPAAFCGLAGFKPTARRVPRAGCFELSATLDSLGPLASTVSCCRLMDGVLAGEDGASRAVDRPPVFGLPGTYFLDGCDPEVTARFEQAVRDLERSGARFRRLPADCFGKAGEMVATASFATIEGWARHGAMFRRIADRMDPMVYSRFATGAAQAARLDDLRRLRAELIAEAARVMADIDAVVMPTAPILPPREAEVADEAGFLHFNGLALRNTAVANFIDGCALAMPCSPPGEAPVGLTLMGQNGQDHRILALGEWAEARLSRG